MSHVSGAVGERRRPIFRNPTFSSASSSPASTRRFAGTVVSVASSSGTRPAPANTISPARCDCSFCALCANSNACARFSADAPGCDSRMACSSARSIRFERRRRRGQRVRPHDHHPVARSAAPVNKPVPTPAPRPSACLAVSARPSTPTYPESARDRGPIAASVANPRSRHREQQQQNADELQQQAPRLLDPSADASIRCAHRPPTRTAASPPVASASTGPAGTARPRPPRSLPPAPAVRQDRDLENYIYSTAPLRTSGPKIASSTGTFVGRLT